MIQTNQKWWVERVGSGLGRDEFEKLKNSLIESSFLEFANTDAGEIVLHELFDFCGFDKVNYSNDFKDATFQFLEGQKSVFLHIMQLMEISQYKMMAKQKKAKTIEEAEGASE